MFCNSNDYLDPNIKAMTIIHLENISIWMDINKKNSLPRFLIFEYTVPIEFGVRNPVNLNLA